MVPEGLIQMGVIGRPHGVRGLVHLHSYTADPADLPSYGPFVDDRGRRFSVRWHSEGVAAVIELVEGKKIPVADRETAAKLVNTRLLVPRAKLPKTDDDEFYLADLVGLMAFGVDGKELGRVSAVHDYGAGASLEIGPLMIPFTRACVPEVDLAAGRVSIVVPDELVVPGEALPAEQIGEAAE